MKNIVIIGAGFAGLWSAIAAVRRLDELNVARDQVSVTLINRDAWHGIRVRNYESDLSQIRVPLDSVLAPTGVQLIKGEVTAIDPKSRSIALLSPNGQQDIIYDRLVLAAGSRVFLPDIPGLAEHGLNIDTYNETKKLDLHLKGLSHQAQSDGWNTVLVIGAGLTGIEIACEMPNRLKAVGIQSGRVILADRLQHIGSDIGIHARAVIHRALDNLGIEIRTAIKVAAIGDHGVTLTDGERISARTVVWCAGMVASPLAARLPAERDRWGRLLVDEHLKVEGLDDMYAAGDIAAANIDNGHTSVMSCQHARPMGRFAGHNAVSDLLGEKTLPLHIPWYSTCLDLGPAGAVQTQGWNRLIVATGAKAKETKKMINCVRIYPPKSRDRSEILAAAAPVVQAPPGKAAS